jgi:bifunctional non-homologous end joining protein LigD
LSAYTPMKAVLTDAPFDDPNWIFERKLDGIRCMAHRDGGAPVRLVSRTDKVMTGQFPEVAEALDAQPVDDFVVDGELVAFQGGITSFSRLQRRAREQVAVFLYVFDLLRLDGRDVRDLPLRERKVLLRDSLEFGGQVRYSQHRNEQGTKLFREACKQGLEGLVAKRADSPYRSAARSRDWLKLKCHFEQELVIGGFTAPHGSRTDFGALLVGYNEVGERAARASTRSPGRLRYAGKVGTGFDHATLEELGGRLRGLEREEPPFADVHPIPPGTHWVEPELVAQIAFSEWTRDGRLRHPRYLGLRDDKPAGDVVRERPS